MKLPKKIKVAGQEYKVTYPYKFKGEEKRALGQNSFNQLTIKLADKDVRNIKIHPCQTIQTLIHEILHSIVNHYDGGKVKEIVVERLAEGIYQVLRDNPELIKLFKRRK